MNLGFWLAAFGVLLVAALYVSLVYLAWRALFHDRANGRRRCPKCWYDLSYSPGMRCSECGYTARREAEFGRTRRQYGRATGAILLCVLIALFIHERVLQSGAWSQSLPTPLLMLAIPLADGPARPIASELSRRLSRGDLSERQEIALMRRWATGDMLSRPPSDRWIEKYGRLIWRHRLEFTARNEEGRPDPRRAPYSPQEETLLDVPPRISIATRSRWPRDPTPYLHVNLAEWWPAASEALMTITLRPAGAQAAEADHAPVAITVLYDATDRSRGACAIPLDAAVLGLDLTGGDQPALLEVDVAIKHRRPGSTDQWHALPAQTLLVPISTVDAPTTEVIEPVSGPDLDQAMRLTLAGDVVRWTDGPSPLRVRYNPQATFIPAFDDTAIGLTVELHYRGQLARHLDVWWIAGERSRQEQRRVRGRRAGFSVEYENHDLLHRPADADAWIMHVRSNPEVALRAGDAPRYWEGSFAVPMRFFEEDESAPPRRWTVLDK